MGDCPDWWPLMVAAKWMQVPPWELERQPIRWRDRALAAAEAEHHATEVHNRLGR